MYTGVRHNGNPRAGRSCFLGPHHTGFLASISLRLQIISPQSREKNSIDKNKYQGEATSLASQNNQKLPCYQTMTPPASNRKKKTGLSYSWCHSNWILKI